jgi:hypothetical protein
MPPCLRQRWTKRSSEENNERDMNKGTKDQRKQVHVREVKD